MVEKENETSGESSKIQFFAVEKIAQFSKWWETQLFCSNLKYRRKWSINSKNFDWDWTCKNSSTQKTFLPIEKLGRSFFKKITELREKESSSAKYFTRVGIRIHTVVVLKHKSLLSLSTSPLWFCASWEEYNKKRGSTVISWCLLNHLSDSCHATHLWVPRPPTHALEHCSTNSHGWKCKTDGKIFATILPKTVNLSSNWFCYAWNHWQTTTLGIGDFLLYWERGIWVSQLLHLLVGLEISDVVLYQSSWIRVWYLFEKNIWEILLENELLIKILCGKGPFHCALNIEVELGSVDRLKKRKKIGIS